MAGIGRHVPTYALYKPKSIVLVDINEEAIKKAKEQYPRIEGHAKELVEWTKTETRQFKVLIGMWCISFLDGPATTEFLVWCQKHVEYAVFVEPIHNREVSEEQFLHKE